MGKLFHVPLKYIEYFVVNNERVCVCHEITLRESSIDMIYTQYDFVTFTSVTSTPPFFRIQW